MKLPINGNGQGGNSQPRLFFVAVFSFFACLGAFLMGFNIGYATQTTDELNLTTNDAVAIRSSDTAEISTFNVSCFSVCCLGGRVTAVISPDFSEKALFPVGALVGGFFAGGVSDTVGRKPAILIGTIPQLIGWVAITVAHLMPTHAAFLAVIFLGRFFCGLGAGWNSLCVPVYITEISPADKRGFFGSWNQLFVTVGLLVALSLGIPQEPQSNFHYYYVSIVAIGIIAVFVTAMLFVDESPVWLLAHGKLDKGEAVLRRLRGPHVDVSREVDEIMGSQLQVSKVSLLNSLLEFRRCPVLVPFVLSLAVMFFQQFGGINALAFYASQQLQQAQVPDYKIVSSFTVGGTQVVFTVVGVVLVERLGRKVLLVASGVGMAAASFMLGADLFLVASDSSVATRYSPLAIASFVLYNAAFSVGWGPLPWVMMSELVPTSVRGISTGVATAFNWSSVAIITFVVNYYTMAVHPYGEWFTFGGIMFVSVFFVVFLLPETRGRTMDEIQRGFESFGYQRCLFPGKRDEGVSSDSEPLLFDSKDGRST